MVGLQTVRAAARNLVQRGPREVVWTPDYMGLGNLLYLALWCDADPDNRRFLRTARIEPWLEVFPSLAELTVRRDEVRRSDVRRSAVSESYGRLGEDFDQEHLHDFVRRRLLCTFKSVDDDRVVVNVRRGDYYADHNVRGYFAFDVDAYLQVALPRVVDQRPVSEVHVVSDGLDWCRARLGWVETRLGLPLTFATGSGGPAADFETAATARRLVATNSTFSYWAGYVHDVLYPGSQADVWAPRFFSRWQDDYSAWQLDPRWSIVEHIPGGWNS